MQVYTKSYYFECVTLFKEDIEDIMQLFNDDYNIIYSIKKDNQEEMSKTLPYLDPKEHIYYFYISVTKKDFTFTLLLDDELSGTQNFTICINSINQQDFNILDTAEDIICRGQSSWIKRLYRNWGLDLNIISLAFMMLFLSKTDLKIWQNILFIIIWYCLAVWNTYTIRKLDKSKICYYKKKIILFTIEYINILFNIFIQPIVQGAIYFITKK